MKTKDLFITGTNTGIGKTIIATYLAKTLAVANFSVAYYKPVQTGSTFENNKCVASPDSDFVSRSLKKDAAKAQLKIETTYNFAYPASPHLCSRLEKKPIELSEISKKYTALKKQNTKIIVEGAGGILVPLNDQGTSMADLALKLDLNSIIVASASLGTLNHTLLTINYLQAKNIPLKAIFLMLGAKEDQLIIQDNFRFLKNLYPQTEIFFFPYLGKINTEQDILPELVTIPTLPDSKKILGWFN